MLFSFDYKPYIAVIADIKQSKMLLDRNTVQNTLQDLLDTINKEYHAYIASNFTITLGDEFQGLLKSGACLIELIERIEQVMWPVQLRFGLGVGEITTEIHADTLGTDGPAYYLAREMITELKASEKKKMEPNRNIEINIKNNEQHAILLNTTFSLLFALKKTWTKRQDEIINVYLGNDSKQTDTAKVLHINQSSVHRALTSAYYFTYRDAMQTMSELLSEIKEDVHV